MIMVNRLWLEELEINFGNCVRIKLGNGQLIIGSNEEKHKKSMLKSFDGKNKRRDFRRKKIKNYASIISMAGSIPRGKR